MQFYPSFELPLKTGFTLIELSIVLVIIGLVTGSILVGRDLINAAGVRAQISQIEKYQTAVNTFRGKYGYLPGDMPEGPAQQFGFLAASSRSVPGKGDGNGIIQGFDNYSVDVAGDNAYCGETGMFWVDLNTAGMLDFAPNLTIANNLTTCNFGPIPANQVLPAAKIGRGNLVYVWSGGIEQRNVDTTLDNGLNYFGISSINWNVSLQMIGSEPALTVAEAYNIDTKIDDGMPTTGKVLAAYLDNGDGGPDLGWAGGGSPHVFGDSGYWPYFDMDISDPTYAPYFCFDTVGGVEEHYSTEVNNGENVNCALSFQFQ